MSNNRVYGVALLLLGAGIVYFVYMVVTQSIRLGAETRPPSAFVVVTATPVTTGSPVVGTPASAGAVNQVASPTPLPENGPTPSPSEFLATAIKGVARVQTADREGSAFLARQQGSTTLWVTNAHVVADTSTAFVIPSDGSKRVGEVVARDEANDVAVIAVDGLTTVPPLPVGRTGAVTPGDSLYVVGFPLGSDLAGPPSVTRGIVSGMRTFQNISYIQTDAAINPGNSGGPVLDPYGGVIGIATWKISLYGTVQGISFALPASFFLDALDHLGTVKAPSLAVAGVWQDVTSANAPATRYHDTTVWTGTELLVWGGLAAQGFPGDGARYNPKTANWKTMAATGAPSPRSLNVGVWTGSELVIWSGTHSTSRAGFLADGARYDPGTDKWRALPPSPLSPRIGADGIWTGHDVIIWGGIGGTDAKPVYYGDGARFTPSTNRWTLLPASQAPTARWLHTMVWTGLQAIVWGGEDDNGGPHWNGAIYDPMTNAWTPLPMALGKARLDPKAVWTGGQMIVWGGLDDSGASSKPATSLRSGPKPFTPTNSAGLSLVLQN